MNFAVKLRARSSPTSLGLSGALDLLDGHRVKPSLSATHQSSGSDPFNENQQRTRIRLEETDSLFAQRMR